MASNPPSMCCNVGIKREGTTAGKSIKIGDNTINVYIASAAADKAHDGTAILFSPRRLRHLSHSQLIADRLAANGYTTLIPDLFSGDTYKSGGDVFKWIKEGTDGKNPHTTDAVDPIILAGIKALRDEYGAVKISAVGYCFGAKYVIRHYEHGIDVGYVAHPSLVTREELAAIGGPLSIAAAETEFIFPTDKRRESEDILKDTGLPYQINLFSEFCMAFL